MKKILTLALLGLSLACGSDEEAAASVEAAGAAATEALEQATEAATEPEAPPAEEPTRESNFGTISIAPGFAPDPHTVSGTSGGSANAADLNSECAGQISANPDHLLVAGGTFTELRIMAYSETDVTLVVQRPDGTFLCNDDAEETHPIVTGTFPAGTYKIYIGSYDPDTNGRYTLGISELPNPMPSMLAE